MQVTELQTDIHIGSEHYTKIINSAAHFAHSQKQISYFQVLKGGGKVYFLSASVLKEGFGQCKCFWNVALNAL